MHIEIIRLREDAKRNRSSIIKMLLRPKLALIVWFRICNYLVDSHLKLLFYPAKLLLHLYRQITGIQIDAGTQMGGGIYFEHYSCIAITKGALIGRNITLFQGTTIGKNYGGSKYGYPIVGDNVIVFAGAKIIGSIKVGNNVIIGANSVVVNDVPDNCVVAGVPAKIITDNYKEAISEDEYTNHFNLHN